MKMRPGRWRCGALLMAVCLAWPDARGETPPAWNGSAGHGFIVSVLQREDTVFASTDLGLYRAALSDKVWHKLPLPDSAPSGGCLAREAGLSPLLVYYTQRSEFGLSKSPSLVMYGSKDSGQTWERTSVGRAFDDVFVHSDGNIYADERMQTPGPPPRREGGTASTTGPGGQTLHVWHRLVVSNDLGKNWRDISDGLPSGLVYHLLRSLDFPDLIRVAGGWEGHIGGGGYYEADDRNYHWREVPWQAWRGDPGERKYFFGSLSPGSNNVNSHADLDTLLQYPFLKWGNTIDMQAVQIETEKPEYTFRQGEPMPVALKVYFIFKREPLRFADNEDETICWALRGYPVDGDFFHTSSKAEALYVDSPDREAKLAASRNGPGARIVALDGEHPYRRTVDLARIYRFPGPGKYRVQPWKTLCPFFKQDASFAGQVIDVTITP